MQLAFASQHSARASSARLYLEIEAGLPEGECGGGGEGEGGSEGGGEQATFGIVKTLASCSGTYGRSCHRACHRATASKMQIVPPRLCKIPGPFAAVFAESQKFAKMLQLVSTTSPPTM